MEPLGVKDRTHISSNIHKVAKQQAEIVLIFSKFLSFLLGLLYNLTSVVTNIPSCRQDELEKSFPLQEGIFVYSRVFVQYNTCIITNKTSTF